LHARQLLKRKTIAQLWTTNGKILMKDKDNRIYETNTMDALGNTDFNTQFLIMQNILGIFVYIFFWVNIY
jgi:hypothetical protein